MKATDTLWTVANEATTHVKQENANKGGLAFWSRMYADKTMFEAMGQETPSFNPPFTVSLATLFLAITHTASSRPAWKSALMHMHAEDPYLRLCGQKSLL